MKAVVIALLSVFVAGAASTPASADCTCRAPGFIAHHGQTVCLKTAQGPRLARCDMVLNNAAWKISSEPCPEAALAPLMELAAQMSVAPERADLIR